MERIQITMGNGEKYITKWEDMHDFEEEVINHLGSVRNSFVEIKDDIYINPSHISIVELVEE